MNITTNAERMLKDAIVSSYANMHYTEDTVGNPSTYAAIGHIFAVTLHNMEYSFDLFKAEFSNRITEVKDNRGNKVELSDIDTILSELVKFDFLVDLLNTGILVIGTQTARILDLDQTSYKPYKQGEVVEKTRRYAESGNIRQQLDIMQKQEYTADLNMLSILRRTYVLARDSDIHAKAFQVLESNLHHLKGASEMEAHEGVGIPVRSEYAPDGRYRTYPQCYAGPIWGAGDVSKSLWSAYHATMSTDYDIEVAKDYCIRAMDEYGSWGNLAAKLSDIHEANTNPEKFLLKYLVPKKLRVGQHITGAAVFVKIAIIYTKLVNVSSGGEIPLIDFIHGKDAKCSGMQIGGFITGSPSILKRTGVIPSVDNEADVYGYSAQQFNATLGLTATRNDLKKPFTSQFYGAGEESMRDASKLDVSTYDALYGDIDPEQEDYTDAVITRCALLRSIIKNVFGKELNDFRSKILSCISDYETRIPKIGNGVQYFLPDGVKVALDERLCIDLYGSVVDHDNPPSSITVHIAGEKVTYDESRFKTMDKNLNTYGRTGFVNLIQSIDACVIRQVIINLDSMGARSIVHNHDFIGVYFEDEHMLTPAIKKAYMALFGTGKSNVTRALPKGTDFTKLYFEGIVNVALPEYKQDAIDAMNAVSMFYEANGKRKMVHSNGHFIKDLINNLNQGGDKGTYFFS